MQPSGLLSVFLPLWVVAFGAIVFYKVAVGEITLNGLLTVDGQRVSPGRIQLLLATLVGVFSFLASALDTHRLPVIPDSLLASLFASHSVYLTGKGIHARKHRTTRR